MTTDPISAYTREQRRRHLSPATIDKTTRNLRLFTADLGLTPTREQVEDWLDSRQLSAKSRALWLSTLHCYYAYLTSEGLVAEDPTARIRPPKLRRNLPRPIPDNQLNAAIAVATPLMRCWLLLEAYGGLRCMEVAGLNREDVLEAEGLLRITKAKGGRERMVPLHPEVLKALQRYGLPDDGPLFVGRTGRQVTAGDVSHRMGDYLHSLGIRSTPHSLRHAFATKVYRSSLDIRLVQNLLGHESVATTSIYASADMGKAAGVVGALRIA